MKHLSKWFELITSIKFGWFFIVAVIRIQMKKWFFIRHDNNTISHSIRLPNFNLENISLNLFIFHEFLVNFEYVFLFQPPTVYHLTNTKFILNLPSIDFCFSCQFIAWIVYFWDFDVWERKWIINFEIAPYFFALFCVSFYDTESDSDSGISDKSYTEKSFDILSS